MVYEPVTFVCSHCGAVFADSDGLRAHGVRHRGALDKGGQQARALAPLTFACSHCGASFSNRWRLRAHAVQHGVVASAEWQPLAGPKPRVAAVPIELSARRQAGVADEASPSNEAWEGRSGRRLTAKRLVLAAAALVVVFIAAATALAYFTTAASNSATIRTGTWGSYLTFYPGTSQATHYSSCGSPQSVLIATADKQGNLSLDFGDVLVPSTTSWTDVFHVTSSAPASLKVSFKAGGALAPFIASVGFAADTTGGALDPKQTRDVAVQIVVPATTSPGTYAGTLTVAVVGSTESHTIPMTVRVLAQKPQPSYLTFCPGTSKATHYSTNGCPQSALIASSDKMGNLSLDFGDVLLPSSTSWTDVFRVTSSAPASLRVSFTAGGALAPFMASVGFAADTTGGALNSKQTRSVAVQVVVPKTATAGTYSGTLTVAVVGSSESHTIPMTVRVLAQKPQPTYLTFACGTSQATRYPPSGCPQSALIATLDKQGNLSLDFGDVLLPSSTSWTDVFRVASCAPASVKVSFKSGGALAPFIASVGFANDKTGGTLSTKQTRDVAVQIVVPKTATPGTYAGTVTVAVVGGSESHTIPMTVTVLTHKPYLTFCCGTSKATHYSSSRCLQSALIATLDKQGNLSLDFGDVLLPSSTSWTDVFRTTSAAPAALKISFTASTALAPFVASVGFAGDTTGGALNPKQTRDVAVQLVVPKAAAPGTYTGTLTVAVVGSSESYAIPMTVRVPAQKPGPSGKNVPIPSMTPKPKPRTTTTPSPDPTPSTSTSPSETPKPSTSPSVTPEPSVSPSASPTPSPSATASKAATPTPTPSATAKVVASLTSFFGSIAKAIASLI